MERREIAVCLVNVLAPTMDLLNVNAQLDLLHTIEGLLPHFPFINFVYITQLWSKVEKISSTVFN